MSAVMPSPAKNKTGIAMPSIMREIVSSSRLPAPLVGNLDVGAIVRDFVAHHAQFHARVGVVVAALPRRRRARALIERRFRLPR